LDIPVGIFVLMLVAGSEMAVGDFVLSEAKPGKILKAKPMLSRQ